MTQTINLQFFLKAKSRLPSVTLGLYSYTVQEAENLTNDMFKLLTE
jgi:hypothetical protein